MNKAGWTAVLCVVAMGAYAKTVERNVPAQSRGQVEITNVAGEVQVQGWDRDEVQVRGDIDERVERVDVVAKDDLTVIKVVVPERSGSRIGARLSIHVPQHSSLVLNTVSANQQIRDVGGSQRLQSVSGNIDTRLGDGYFEMRTVSGDVLAKGSDAGRGLRVTTVSGDVRAEGVGAEVEASTISGDLQIIAKETARALLKSVSGDMSLRAALAAAAQVQAESVSGDIRFNFAEPVNAGFQVRTFSGDIDNCFSDDQATRSGGAGKELRFTQGRGGANVLVKTLSGTVEMCH